MKKTFRYAGLALLFLIGLVLAIVLTIQPDPGQDLTWYPDTQIDSTFTHSPISQTQLEAIRQEYGKNKDLPKEFETSILLALSHYPDLKETAIDFIVRPDDIPLASRPYFGTMLLGKKNRKYKVVISSEGIKSNFAEPILMKNLPLDARVGVVAHELGHTEYYEKHKLNYMIAFAARFFTQGKFERAHERSTDSLVVYRGLGWPAYAYAKYVRTNEQMKPQIEAMRQQAGGNFWLDETYMHYDAILEMMKTMPEYVSY